MIRKHFEAIAAAFLKTKPVDLNRKYFIQWRNDILKIAFVLAEFNPLFKKDTFYKACGLEREDL